MTLETASIFFVPAARTLSAGNLDTSAMMSRKTLEVAVKELHPEEGQSLLASERTSWQESSQNELKSWAHAIRDDGNDAATKNNRLP